MELIKKAYDDASLGPTTTLSGTYGFERVGSQTSRTTTKWSTDDIAAVATMVKENRKVIYLSVNSRYTHHTENSASTNSLQFAKTKTERQICVP